MGISPRRSYSISPPQLSPPLSRATERPLDCRLRLSVREIVSSFWGLEGFFCVLCYEDSCLGWPIPLLSFPKEWPSMVFSLSPLPLLLLLMATRKLNTSAGILEVMGAPLAGSDLRAYVMLGGGLKLKNFKPIVRSKRCFLIFPIRGAERKGLVSVEVKKKKGQHDMKLLAVDIPMASGPDHRLFVIGDEEEYKVGGGLISQLRDPVLKAMAATKEFDDLDQIEEAKEAEREQQEAERKHREEVEKLQKSGHQ